LFAIDPKTEEILVSASEKGSNKINFIERIQRQQNELLFQAVADFTSIAKAADFDMANFKAKDEVCQTTYNKHIENK
jgi:cell division protein FtsI/penicillin-binding protein 2